jgi:hypothetical protein
MPNHSAYLPQIEILGRKLQSINSWAALFSNGCGCLRFICQAVFQVKLGLLIQSSSLLTFPLVLLIAMMTIELYPFANAKFITIKIAEVGSIKIVPAQTRCTLIFTTQRQGL